MNPTTKRLWKTGAWLYVAWGVLHVIVGAIPLVRYAVSGPPSMLAFFGFNVESVEGPMLHATHIIAEHSAELIAFGLLAIIVALTLVAEGSPLGFWLNAVILGIVDIAFVVAEIVPGHVSLVETGIGPALYIAALTVTSIALIRDRLRPTPEPGGELSTESIQAP